MRLLALANVDDRQQRRGGGHCDLTSVRSGRGERPASTLRGALGPALPSAGTVKGHVSAVLSKLEVSSRVQAALIAERADMLGPSRAGDTR